MSLGRLLVRWGEAFDQGREPPLEELCSGQPALLAPLREAVALLRRLRGSAREASTFPPSGDENATLAPTPGAAHSASGPLPQGYDMLGELGRGGMGVVYKVRQAALNRVCALKMILAGEHAGADERARFLAEAESIAKVRHAGIVQVFDYGTHPGLPWFSLELCEGGSLADRLDVGLLPPHEAAGLVGKVARAVQAAHEAGVVHRDLKPANILLDHEGQPRVTDFGLSKSIG